MITVLEQISPEIQKQIEALGPGVEERLNQEAENHRSAMSGVVLGLFVLVLLTMLRGQTGQLNDAAWLELVQVAEGKVKELQDKSLTQPEGKLSLADVLTDQVGTVRSGKGNLSLRTGT